MSVVVTRRAYKSAIVVGLIVFAVHLLLVLGVLYLDLTATNREVITVWVLIAELDFPVSKVVYLLNPSYGIPVATAFAFIGGLQWFLIAGVIAWFWRSVISKAARKNQ
jgi:hypothetical protein